MAEAARATVSKTPLAHAVGRRKSAVARGFLRHGTGVITVNKQEYATYFDTDSARLAAVESFRLCPNSSSFDVTLAHVELPGSSKPSARLTKRE